MIALVHEIDEKTLTLIANLNQLKLAAEQVRKRQLLKDTVEFVLSIGNQLNPNDCTLNQASDFLLNILPHLDNKKVNDNCEISFLNVLVYICSVKYGNDFFKTFYSELNGVENASKGK